MSDKIKDIISEILANFLVKDDKLPENVKIALHYESSTAQLNISRERLEELLNKDKLLTPEEVRAMTGDEIKENYAAIMRSMKEWKL